MTKWMLTKAQTGHGRLDTHFSNFNFILKYFFEDGNDITLEEDIIDALKVRNGVARIMGVLEKYNDVNGLSISKKFKTKTEKSRVTHDFFGTKIKLVFISHLESPN